MTGAALVAAWATAVVSGLAALVGAVAWWQVRQSRAFWAARPGAQAVAVGQAIVAGVLAVLSFDPDDGLYWLYALLPVAVGFFAEQLRIVSTEQVLERARAARTPQRCASCREDAQRPSSSRSCGGRWA